MELPDPRQEDDEPQNSVVNEDVPEQLVCADPMPRELVRSQQDPLADEHVIDCSASVSLTGGRKHHGGRRTHGIRGRSRLTAREGAATRPLRPHVGSLGRTEQESEDRGALGNHPWHLKGSLTVSVGHHTPTVSVKYWPGSTCRTAHRL